MKLYIERMLNQRTNHLKLLVRPFETLIAMFIPTFPVWQFRCASLFVSPEYPT